MEEKLKVGNAGTKVVGKVGSKWIRARKGTLPLLWSLVEKTKKWDQNGRFMHLGITSAHFLYCTVNRFLDRHVVDSKHSEREDRVLMRVPRVEPLVWSQLIPVAEVTSFISSLLTFERSKDVLNSFMLCK